MDWTSFIGYVFSAVTGIAGWIAGRQKRNNDFLGDLQRSINMLAEENAKLLEELVGVRKENAELKRNQEEMKTEIVKLRQENAELQRRIDELNYNISRQEINLLYP